MPGTLVLLRHGQSTWNLKNLFTGWTDVDLTEQGIAEAKAAGQQLQSLGLEFDVAHTSVLKRAIKTLWLALTEMDRVWIPVTRSWRLNERHYGSLQGLDKAETAAKHGADQVKIWRRSYATPPPAVAPDDDRHPAQDGRYRNIPLSALPGSESLKTTLDRVRPHFEDVIAPDLLAGKNVLVAAHGNSLRALVKMLESISDDAITEFNIPTGVPRLYELTATLEPIKAEFVGDPESIARAAEAVANQAKQ